MMAESSSDDLIAFSDRRLREHHRRQSVTVDDTDLMLHKRANRRSILYGGDSKGPKFWSQLSAAWNNSGMTLPGNSTKDNVVSPSPSPTSVRDVQQQWNAQQETAIFKASQNLGMPLPPTTSSNEDDNPGLLKVSYSVDNTDGSSHRTSVTSCSTHSYSSHGMDHSNTTISSSYGGGDPSHPFLTVWDRLDAMSIQEYRQIQAYHQTVTTQNDQIHGKNVSEESQSQPLAQQLYRGRLRRQNSWNGRDSQRNLHVARGSILAEVDDCTLSQLMSVLEGQQVHDTNETTPNGLGVSGGNGGNNPVESETAQSKNEQYVMNL
ncbi:MAG: hypothetical protein SGARI_004425, partial [Bacillariaceae sp.]